jgi:hypothetical protein
MALKMVKPIVEVSPVIEPVVMPETVLVQPGLNDIEAITKEYIELWKKFDYFEVKALVKRMDEIRKVLQTVANDTMDGKKPAVFACPEGEVEFSPRQTATEVPDPLGLVQNLLTKFGPEATASVVDIAITPLRKLLSELELKAFVHEVPGGRIIKSVRPAK